MGNTLWLSLYIKADGTGLEFVAGPRKSYPKIRGLDEIVYHAEFRWPRKKGAYQLVMGVSKRPDLPPSWFQPCGEHRFRKGDDVAVDLPVELLSLSANGGQ